MKEVNTLKHPTITVLGLSLASGLLAGIATWYQSKMAADQAYDDFQEVIKLREAEGQLEELEEIAKEDH